MPGLRSSTELPQGRELRVGPGELYPHLAAVAPELLPGDRVVIAAGAEHVGETRLTRSGLPGRPIVIRGERRGGRRPVLAGGKTTLELAGHHYVIEGLEITGGSRRCVLHHANDIVLRDVLIRDCPAHGLLGADSGSGSLLLEHSEVRGSGNGERLHQIYMATDESAFPGSVFRMQHCYVHDGRGGNNVKSRAERNELYYNWIEGAYYHELELIGPDGQPEHLAREDSDVVGNVLFQSNAARTHFPIRVGGDGTGQTWGRYRFVNNTIVLGAATTSAVFRVFHGVESLEMHNNVLYRRGGAPVQVLRDVEARWKDGPQVVGSNNWISAGSTAVPNGWVDTLQGADPGFADLTSAELRPGPRSPLLDRARPRAFAPEALAFPAPLLFPRAEPPPRQVLTGAIALRPVVGAGLDIGAFEGPPAE